MSALGDAKLPKITTETARRLLLDAQGLLADPARRTTPKVVHSLIEQMGFVQIDSINVVERAHHLTLFSRLDEYRPAMFAGLLEKKRSLFEHWTHDASAIPSQWFSHWRHRFDRYRTRIRRNAWWRARLGENPDAVIDAVRERIAQDGPLLSKDFEHNRNGKALPENGWWGWKPQKAALEHLWRAGELAVAGRVNFQKVYDLTHRVLPELHGMPASDARTHLDWACRSALERLGFATPAEITAFWHAVDLSTARRWCEEKRNSGEVVEVLVDSQDSDKPKRMFALPDWERRTKRLSDPPERVRLLSPFDPVLRDRKRTKRLFDFDYSFEAFVPAPKRRYGYYVLPILEGDQLIGRLDPKFHRDRSVLEIKGLWLESRAKATKAQRRGIEAAVERLAGFIGAESIKMPSL
jgi:uncharacterized protein